MCFGCCRQALACARFEIVSGEASSEDGRSIGARVGNVPCQLVTCRNIVQCTALILCGLASNDARSQKPT